MLWSVTRRIAETYRELFLADPTKMFKMLGMKCSSYRTKPWRRKHEVEQIENRIKLVDYLELSMTNVLQVN